MIAKDEFQELLDKNIDIAVKNIIKSIIDEQK